jgi:ABC-type uncharacterized transport systems, ATPase components
MEFAVEFKNVTKTFGNVVANKDVSFGVEKGEILALLGENGSGKTTLMNMLDGIYFPDSGHIFVGGKEAVIKSPRDAFDLGVGMIHQHFKLIDVFTAVENAVLGLDKKKYKFDIKLAARKMREICDKYGFVVDPYKKVYNMSVSEKQTLEIVKVLYRGADILILDEPTAVLTPQETEKLFKVMINMRDDGKSIILITHKLNEVLEVSSRVAVLRKGEYVGTVDTRASDELSLTEMMVGQKVELNIERSEVKNPVKRLEVKNLTCKNADGFKALDDVSFAAYGGEILGIAGISGSGQKQLLEAIAGLQKAKEGSSVVYTTAAGEKKQLIGKSPRAIRSLGVALSFVPEDRLGMGLVGEMDVAENMMLKNYDKGRYIFISKREPQKLAERIVKELEVATPNIRTKVRKLSGGNVQKVLVGREIADSPAVLMTAYAVRGLDINTCYTIYRLLNEQKKKGVAVIYVGEDLDVLMELSDRILVLCGGKMNGILDARKTTKEEIGLRMTNLKKEAAE